MENQLRAVGMVINDLRKNRDLLADGIIQSIEENFRDILMQLAYAWFQKVIWADYLLDFHLAEAERLRTFVEQEEGKDYPAVRACLYEELTFLISRLNMLIDGELNVDLSELL